MPLNPDQHRSITAYLRNPDRALTEDDLNRIARLYYDTSPNLWATVDREGNIKHVNPTWENVTGFSLAESRRRKLQDFFIEDSGEAVAILSHLTFEDWRGGRRLNLIRKDGSPLIVGVRGEKFNGDELAHLRLIDMSIRAALDDRLRKAYQEMERRTAYFKAAMDNCPIMIAFHDTDGRYVYVSPGVKSILLYDDPSELIGVDPFSLIHPDDLQTARDLFGKFLARPGQASGEFIRLKTPTGKRPEYVLVKSSGVNLLDDPVVRGFVSWTMPAQNWPATGGGARNDHEDFDAGDDEDLPKSFRS